MQSSIVICLIQPVGINLTSEITDVSEEPRIHINASIFDGSPEGFSGFSLTHQGNFYMLPSTKLW